METFKLSQRFLWPQHAWLFTLRVIASSLSPFIDSDVRYSPHLPKCILGLAVISGVALVVGGHSGDDAQPGIAPIVRASSAFFVEIFGSLNKRLCELAMRCAHGMGDGGRRGVSFADISVCAEIGNPRAFGFRPDDNACCAGGLRWRARLTYAWRWWLRGHLMHLQRGSQSTGTGLCDFIAIPPLHPCFGEQRELSLRVLCRRTPFIGAIVFSHPFCPAPPRRSFRPP